MSYKQELKELKLKRVAAVVTDAVTNGDSTIGSVAKDMECCLRTATRLIAEAREKGYLEVTPTGVPNKSVIRLAQELKLDVDLVYNAVAKAGGRVTATPRKQTDESEN